MWYWGGWLSVIILFVIMWCFPSGHGQLFLERFEDKVPSWVDLVVQGNRAEAILAIIKQTQNPNLQDPYHNLNLVKRVTCPTLVIGK